MNKNTKIPQKHPFSPKIGNKIGNNRVKCYRFVTDLHAKIEKKGIKYARRIARSKWQSSKNQVGIKFWAWNVSGITQTMGNWGVAVKVGSSGSKVKIKFLAWNKSGVPRAVGARWWMRVRVGRVVVG